LTHVLVYLQHCWWDYQLSIRGLTNFPSIFAILFDLLINIKATPRLRSTATPPCARLMPASHSLTSGQGLHRLGPPEWPFHGTHEALQCVRLASNDPLALPFDWIQSHLACVDLDRRTNSTAQAPAASEIYLARCCHWECSYLVQTGASDAPRHEFILKFSYFHFKLTNWCRTTLYHASQPAVIILR
jgi:hypothetical protein